MKKGLIIFSLLVIVVSIFVSCSANSSSEDVSTTAVKDENGTTHYYQPVTENESTSVYAEIVTNDKGKAVRNKNGTYVTKEHTTVLTTVKGTVSKVKSSTTTQSSTTSPADNVIEFEPETDNSTTTTKQNTTIATTTKPIEEETISTTKPTTKIVTDKDGWIEKWY